MVKQIVVMITFSFICLTAFSQKENQRWSVGFNPLSFAESAMSIGPCVSYRLSERIGFWTEASYIFKNSYLPNKWKGVEGFRGIFQTRFYKGKKRNKFIAAEFRIKEYSFSNESSLTYTTGDTSNDIMFSNFKETQLLVGGALVFGKEYILVKKQNIYMEFTFGLGGKHRFIDRNFVVPDGYSQFVIRPIDGPFLNIYGSDNQGTIYFPLALRFFWRL